MKYLSQFRRTCATIITAFFALHTTILAAEPRNSTNASPDLQAAPRFDLQSITGGLPPQTNSTDSEPVSLLAPIAVIQSPKPNEIVNDKEVSIRVGVEIPSRQPRSYHIIVNNDSPILLEDDTAPFPLKNLGQGGNLLRVLIVGPDGKIGPMPQSFAMTYFYFKRRDFGNIVKSKQPFLTVNLPMSGPLVPDEKERVCFDYIVHNAELGNKGIRVKYTLNQREEILDKAGPIYWNNLAPGRYTLQAELLDSKDMPVLGTYCKVERTFEISRVMKPLQIEREDPILLELINQSLTNNAATNTPAIPSTNAPPIQPKKDTLKPNRTGR